jgi:hypothetical protein
VKPEAVDAVTARAQAASVPVRPLGVTGGTALTLSGERSILVKAVVERFESWLPRYMAGGA